MFWKKNKQEELPPVDTLRKYFCNSSSVKIGKVDEVELAYFRRHNPTLYDLIMQTPDTYYTVDDGSNNIKVINEFYLMNNYTEFKD